MEMIAIAICSWLSRHSHVPYRHYFFNPSEQQEQQNLGLGRCYPHGTSEDPGEYSNQPKFT